MRSSPWTSDGRWISLDPYEPKFKTALWTLIERETGLARLPESAGRDAVRSALAGAVRTRTLEQWDLVLGSAEICYAPVLDLAQALGDPQVWVRETVSVSAEHGFRPLLPRRFLPPLQIRPGRHRVSVSIPPRFSASLAGTARASRPRPLMPRRPLPRAHRARSSCETVRYSPPMETSEPLVVRLVATPRMTFPADPMTRLAEVPLPWKFIPVALFPEVWS